MSPINHTRTYKQSLNAWVERGRANVTRGGVTPTPLFAGHIPNRVILGQAGGAATRPNFDEAIAIIARTPGAYERRIFDQAWTSNGQITTMMNSMLQTCDDSNCFPWISLKVPSNDWAGVASGDYDSALTTMRNVAIARRTASKPPFLFALHHEPSGDGSLTDWADMQIYCSNFFEQERDIMAWSCIGNGFLWNSDTSSNVTRRDQMFPQLLINTFRSNNHLVAVDTYDDHTEYTGQTSQPTNGTTNPPPNGAVANKLGNFLDWFRQRNGLVCGIGEFSTIGGGGSGQRPGLREAWAVMRANRDILAVANYFNSSVNSTWDWRLIPDSYAQGIDGSSVDFGGTPLTEARLVYYRTMLAESVSPEYTSPL